jgi:hypothetical protein
MPPATTCVTARALADPPSPAVTSEASSFEALAESIAGYRRRGPDRRPALRHSPGRRTRSQLLPRPREKLGLAFALRRSRYHAPKHRAPGQPARISAAVALLSGLIVSRVAAGRRFNQSVAVSGSRLAPATSRCPAPRSAPSAPARRHPVQRVELCAPDASVPRRVTPLARAEVARRPERQATRAAQHSRSSNPGMPSRGRRRGRAPVCRAHRGCVSLWTNRGPQGSREETQPMGHSLSYALRSWGVALRALMIRKTS